MRLRRQVAAPDDLLSFPVIAQCDEFRMADVHSGLVAGKLKREIANGKSGRRTAPGERMQLADSLLERERFELSVLVCVFSDDVWQDQCETRLTSQRFSGARAKPLLTVR